MSDKTPEDVSASGMEARKAAERVLREPSQPQPSESSWFSWEITSSKVLFWLLWFVCLSLGSFYYFDWPWAALGVPAAAIAAVPMMFLTPILQVFWMILWAFSSCG